MRVLIADKFEKVGIDGLKELGCEVDSQPDLGADTLPGALERVDPQVLIVRGTRVSAAALKSGASLSLVIRAGAGVDTIDVPAASSLGVFVANCPGKNSIAVAELVMGLLLSCDRRIPDQAADLRAGVWNKGEYSKARGLHGRTLGIVGLGQIGREIMTRAHAFGMNVVAWSRNLTLTEANRLGIAYAETPHRGGAPGRCGDDQRRGQRRDEAPGERRVPGRHEAGRLPHQHLARVGGGRVGPGRGGEDARTPGRTRRVSRGSRAVPGRSLRPRW